MVTKVHPYLNYIPSASDLDRTKTINPTNEKSFVFTSNVVSPRNPSPEVESKAATPSSLLFCCLSIRTVLVLVIFIQAIVAALTVWAVSFSLGTKSSNDFVLRSMDLQRLRIVEDIKNYLNTAKGVMGIIKRGAENGEINMNTAKSTLYSIIKEFYSPIISVAFDRGANFPTRTVYAGYQYQMNASYVWNLRYSVQTDNSKDLIHYETNDGINFVEKTRDKNYSVEARDWYQMSLTTNTSLWSSVYKTVSSFSPITTFYYGQVLYNKTTNKRMGFGKFNFNLVDLQSIMKKNTLNDIEYYAFLTETNGNIMGSNFNVDLLTNRTSVFNNTVVLGGVGEIMSMYSKTAMLAGQAVTLSDSKGKSFIISKYPFVFEELKWNIYLLFNERDVLQSVFSLTYASVGVIVGISVLILITGFFTGFLITQPLYVLIHDFTNIQTMQLDEIKERSSVISEINTIYKSLNNMVTQLKEWKSFLPEHLVKSVMEEEEVEVRASLSKSVSGKLSFNSGPKSFANSGKTQFKISSKLQVGLECLGCTMLTIRFSNFGENYSTPEDIMNIFTRLYSIISSTSSTSNGILQIQNGDTFIICWAGQQETGKFKALDSSLKLKRSIDGMNHVLSTEKLPFIDACMSICSNTIFAGNIGNHSKRQFGTFGDLPSKCKRFINFKNSIRIEEMIIVDEQSLYKDSNFKFVTEPVDRIMWRGTIETAYLLVGYAEVANDEWLYELEAKKKQNKVKEFQKAFSVFEKPEVTDQELEGAIDFFSQQDDPISERLFPVLRAALENSSGKTSFKNYHTKVESKITQFYDDREFSSM
ncbi:hypothetical protein ABK040_000182 [Willaertia magna]